MMLANFRRLISIALCTGLVFFCQAQPGDPGKDEKKPYRILTSGRQISIKCSKDIKSLMVWTASGHRIIERKEINSPTVNFSVNVSEKVFFLMLELTNEQRFTEKIGVQ